MELDVSSAFLYPDREHPFETEVSVPPQQINGDWVAFSPVRLSGTYSMLDDNVICLKGTFATVAETSCSVCLKPVELPIGSAFSELFRRDANEDEDESFRYSNKRLPLDHMVLTLVLLALPIRFVCAEGCSAEAELTEWDEQSKVWAEGTPDETPSYRPFEGLADLLASKENLQ